MLELTGITVRYGGLVALQDVSLTVAPGRITGIIGPNGAGKSTLFNVATGFEAPSGGTVHLLKADVTNLRADKRARRGLARTFQRLELFTGLTVRENLLVASGVRRRGARVSTAMATECEALLERLGLLTVADTPAALCSTGTGRMVELGRALMTKPRVLLLDEPASGQNEDETLAFDFVLRQLAAEGLAVAMVEHDLGLVMRICDRVCVLDRGEVIADGTAGEVQANERVQDAYLGAPT